MSENLRGKAHQGEARVRGLSVGMESTNKTVPESLQERLLAGIASGGSVAKGRKDGTKNKRRGGR